MGNRIYKRTNTTFREFQVIIEVKDMKRMTLRFDPTTGHFRLSVPLSLAMRQDFPEQLESFLGQSYGWMQKTYREPVKNLEKGEVQDLLGYVKLRMPYWEERMALRASHVTIKAMKSRWGSCNVKTGHISLNAHLSRHPRECTDYVIVHELAHLVHADHSDAFWALVALHCPDYKELRRRLRL